jgi:hypothetical protein
MGLFANDNNEVFTAGWQLFWRFRRLKGAIREQGDGPSHGLTRKAGQRTAYIRLRGLAAFLHTNCDDFRRLMAG